MHCGRFKFSDNLNSIAKIDSRNIVTDYVFDAICLTVHNN